MQPWTIDDLLCAQRCPRAFYLRARGAGGPRRAAERIPLSLEAARALRGEVFDCTAGEPIPEDAPALWGLHASYEDCVCEADLLVRRENGWELLLDASAYEAREPLVREASFAMRVLDGNGIHVTKVTALLLDQRFVRGEAMDYAAFYHEKDITKRARSFLPKVSDRVAKLNALASLDETPEAVLCENCLRPLECAYWPECTADLPKPNVFDLTGISAAKKLLLYRRGVITFVECLAYGELQHQQQTQILAEILHEPPHVRRAPLEAFLKTLWYPMCFLDFESCQPPVPLFEGMRPFEQMAFQYSLHVVREQGAEPEHREVIVPPGEDPRPALAEGLVRDVPENACVVVYSNGLEKHVIATLAERFPDLRRRLQRMNASMRDLIAPFRSRDYYDRAMNGSCSLKKVLPAVCPDEAEVSYERLDGVQNGHEAMRAYLRAELVDHVDWDETRARLSAYCSVDTLGMVRLVERLEQAVWPNDEGRIPQK